MDEFKQAVKSLTGLRGDKDDRRVGHKGEVLFKLRLIFLHGFVVFFNGVPLVDRNDAALARFVRDAGNLGVLLRKTDRGIDEDDAHVCPVHRHFGAQVAVMLNGILHLALAAQAGSIDERKYAVLVFDGGIHRVAGRTGDVGNDHALLPQDSVQQAGLADIRLADDGNIDDLALVLLFLFLRQMLKDGIQQVARAVSVHGRHLNRVAEAEVIKLIKIRRRVAQRIALIDAHDDRHIAALEHLCDVEVRCDHAGAHIGHENDAVRRINGNLRLCAHLGQNNILRFRLDAARIYQ